METRIKGRVWLFGHDINTDLIIPSYAVYLSRTEQPRHCFASYRPGWIDEVEQGDILIAGRNFGVGGGRPIGDVLRQVGIGLVIAESFNGLGLRNSINAGLPCLPCRTVLEAFSEGQVADVDWATGRLDNRSTGQNITGQPLPSTLLDIVRGGGVEHMLREEGYLTT
jgi:3-isopropylmalate/(R)-2-methylmalate dehydratase small subunit